MNEEELAPECFNGCPNLFDMEMPLNCDPTEWKKRQISCLGSIGGFKLLLILIISTMLIFSGEQVFECSLITFYSMVGILSYLVIGSARDLMGIFAIYYFESTKRVAKIFSGLTIASEGVMVLPGVWALSLSLALVNKDDTCSKQIANQIWVWFSTSFSTFLIGYNAYLVVAFMALFKRKT